MSHAKFFAYGSFVEGQVHFKYFKEHLIKKGVAHSQGSMCRLPVGYPILLEQGSDLIEGELFGLEVSEMFFSVLDKFFGYSAATPQKSLYLRREVEVVTDKISPVKAWTYVANPAKLPKGVVPIARGDWRGDLTSQQPLTEYLNADQKKYLLQLAQSSGRQIVPIRLELYRDLMSRDFIVDKGRRLALSRLGKEVVRFLD